MKVRAGRARALGHASARRAAPALGLVFHAPFIITAPHARLAARPGARHEAHRVAGLALAGAAARPVRVRAARAAAAALPPVGVPARHVFVRVRTGHAPEASSAGRVRFRWRLLQLTPQNFEVVAQPARQVVEVLLRRPRRRGRRRGGGVVPRRRPAVQVEGKLDVVAGLAEGRHGPVAVVEQREELEQHDEQSRAHGPAVAVRLQLFLRSSPPPRPPAAARPRRRRPRGGRAERVGPRQHASAGARTEWARSSARAGSCRA